MAARKLPKAARLRGRGQTGQISIRVMTEEIVKRAEPTGLGWMRGTLPNQEAVLGRVDDFKDKVQDALTKMFPALVPTPVSATA